MHNRLFDPHAFVDDVAAESRPDGLIPDPDKGIGRQCYAFSRQEHAAHAIAIRAALSILSGMRYGADYTIEVCPIGNVYFTFVGSDTSLAPFEIHSHLDSVKNGGKYDGVDGIAIALTVLQSLVHGERPRRNLRLVVFRSEESSPKNGKGCLGSSIAVGLEMQESLNKIMYEPGRPLSQLFVPRRWAAICAMHQRAILTPQNTAGCYEVHIEQSAHVARSGARVGIVVGGIGGAWREVAEHPVEASCLGGARTEYSRFVVTFVGVADHTGNTPPNPDFRGATLHRRDALVAAGVVARLLLRTPHAHLMRSAPREDVGFTSVPHEQVVEFLVPSNEADQFDARLQEMRTLASNRFGVRMSHERLPCDGDSVDTVPRDIARAYMGIAPTVARLSQLAYRRQGTTLGKTRATIVDFHLTPDKLVYKLDGREVDHFEGDRLRRDIHAYAERVFGSAGVHRTISSKRSQAVDPRLTATLKAVVQRLGIPYIEMPCCAGHDTDRCIEAGIPGAMLLIRQEDGVSHSPFERREKADFDIAALVSREFITEVLRG